MRVVIRKEIIFSCSLDKSVKAWTLFNNNLKYEFTHSSQIDDMVIGRKGTPLHNQILSISNDRSCRVSNLETGAEMKKIDFDSSCRSIAVDKSQTMIAIGTDANVTFIETTNFTKVKEVSLNDPVYSLAFNRQNDCMLAITKKGEVHSFKFRSKH